MNLLFMIILNNLLYEFLYKTVVPLKSLGGKVDL